MSLPGLSHEASHEIATGVPRQPCIEDSGLSGQYGGEPTVHCYVSKI